MNARHMQACRNRLASRIPAAWPALVFSLVAFALTASPVWGQLVGPGLFEGREQAQPVAERPAEAEARVAALGAELLARYGMAPPPAGKEAAPRAAALSALELARGRAEALVALISDAPARALEAALPAEALDELRARNPELAPHLEQRGEWEGAAALIVADDFERGRSWEFHLLETPQGGALEAYGVSVGRRNGGRMRVFGIALRGRIAVQEVHPEPAAEPQNPEPGPSVCDGAIGEQKTAVYLVYRRGEQPPEVSAAEAREVVFGAENSLAYHIRKMSFGQAWLSGEVLTPEPVELDTGGGLPNVADVEQATGLANLGDRFQRHIFIDGPAIFGPLVEGGRATLCGGRIWLDPGKPYIKYINFHVLVHEFGHNLGMAHAKRLDPAWHDPDGTEWEYGDPFSKMGHGPGYFSAQHLLRTGWINEDNIVTVDEYDQGRYALKLPYADGGHPPGSSPVALRIRRKPRIEDDEQWLPRRITENVGPDGRGRLGAPIDLENEEQWLWVEGQSRFASIDPPTLADTVQIRVASPVFGYATYAVLPFPLETIRKYRLKAGQLPAGLTWEDPNSPLLLRAEFTSDGLTVHVRRYDPDEVPRISANGFALATGTPVVGRIVPNALISVFGQGFAAAGTRAPSPVLDAAGRVAGNLADTCLEIGGARAPLFYVSPTQINAQAPSHLPPGQTPARVLRGCDKIYELLPDSTITVAVAAVSPAFFNLGGNADGRNPLVALHGGGPALVGPPELGAAFTPAEPGEVVTLFGTGFGTTEPALATGAIPGAAVPLAYDVSFSVGGIAVPSRDILYAGAAPCCAGLYQFTLRVPPDTSDGNAPVRATVRGIPSPAGPFLSVRRQQ